MKSLLIGAAIVALGTLNAHAEGQNYEMSIARLNGSLQCTIDHTAEAFDCTLHVAGQKHLTLEMKPIQNKKGALVGYFGMDKVSDGNGQNSSLVVMADESKQMHGLSMISDNHQDGNPSFNASISNSAAQTLHAANIAPISVDATDMSAIKVNLNFLIYGAEGDALVQNGNRDDITRFLLDKIQPYLLSLNQN
jgi:hypothetical protein